MKSSFYQDCLREELTRRCECNPRYSLRAFARSLGFEPTVISQVISGKRVPALKSAQRLIRALGLSPEESREFIISLAETQKQRGLQRLNPEFKMIAAEKAKPPELSLEVFRMIADIHHYAILALTQTRDFKKAHHPVKWIASQLGLSETEAKLAVERLVKLGLLRAEKGRWVSTQIGFTTMDKQLTDAALKRHQKQVLEKSLHSLENDPIEVRSHTSMTLAIDPRKIDEAKRRIESFTQELSAFLESGQRTRVYELGISLFPMQKLTALAGTQRSHEV